MSLSVNLLKRKEEHYMVKKVKTAVALGFEPGDQAPKIIATGKGYLADKIIEEA